MKRRSLGLQILLLVMLLWGGVVATAIAADRSSDGENDPNVNQLREAASIYFRLVSSQDGILNDVLMKMGDSGNSFASVYLARRVRAAEDFFPFRSVDKERLWLAGPSGACPLRLIRNLADAGNADAQDLLGRIYDAGLCGVGEDPSKGFEWFQKAMEKNPSSLGSAGGDLYLGRGVKKDAARALPMLIQADARGSRFVQSTIAEIYLKGDGVPRSTDLGWKWYQKAVTNKDPVALARMGIAYSLGQEGLPQDAALGKEMCAASALTGYVGGVACQAYVLYVNRLSSADVEAANEIYRRLAEKNVPEALVHVGARVAQGREGFAKDEKLGLSLCQKAADLESSDGIMCVGELVEQGIGMERNPSEAVRLFRKAADLGSPAAQALYGEYLAGTRASLKPDVPDIEQGLRYCNASMAKGNRSGEFCVGKILIARNTVKEDSEEGRRIIQKLAQKGFLAAQTQLGVYYATGSYGFSVDGKEAIRWLQPAADAGFAYAQYYLGAIYANGIGVATDGGLAAKWISMAADQKNGLAEYVLAGYYKSGAYGISKDEKMAQEYYARARSHGYVGENK